MATLIVSLFFASIMMFVIGGSIASSTRYFDVGTGLFITGLIGIIVMFSIMLSTSP